MTVLTVAAVGTQAYSQYKQGSETNKAYRRQAELTEMQGEQQYKAGQKQSELIQDSAKQEGKAQKLQEAQIFSAQRAALAANGIDLSSVTAQDITSDSFNKAKIDEMNMRYNADINSWTTMENARQKRWSSKLEASQLRYSGKQAKRAGTMQAFTTLAVGAAKMGAGAAGTPATAGKGGYGLGTPKGSINMGTWTKLA